jgi:Subtilase family
VQDEGHTLLTRSRAATLSGLATIIMLAGAASAPAAPAALTARTTTASSSAIPASAGSRIAHELLSAWQITKGEGVTIALLSTGIDHVTGLSGKVINGPDYAPLADAPAVDGTVMASMIAGSGPTAANPLGTIGRAPGARILAERIADYGGGRGASRYQQDQIWQNIVAKAIRYAVKHGAGIIVVDETGNDDSPALDSAVAYAISKNVVIIGSDYVYGSAPDEPQYPASLPGVIDFGGSTIAGGIKPLHTEHPAVNNTILVTAPDNVVFATGPGNEVYYGYGSYSTVAWGAGTVALIKSVYPHITPAQVARALALSASYHPAGGYNTTVGFGLINPEGALQEAGKLVKLSTTAVPGPAVVNADARFGGGPAPGIIDAVHHAPVKLAGFSAAIVVGLVLLVLALLIARRRRRSSAATGGTPEGGEPTAGLA